MAEFSKNNATTFVERRREEGEYLREGEDEGRKKYF